MPATNVVEIPQHLKTLACGKCGREISVSKNTILAYCRDCSANLGVKR
jgi:DNA-directed RNA polymerase subunit RPC12/RpoP